MRLPPCALPVLLLFVSRGCSRLSCFFFSFFPIFRKGCSVYALSFRVSFLFLSFVSGTEHTNALGKKDRNETGLADRSTSSLLLFLFLYWYFRSDSPIRSVPKRKKTFVSFIWFIVLRKTFCCWRADIAEREAILLANMRAYMQIRGQVCFPFILWISVLTYFFHSFSAN